MSKDHIYWVQITSGKGPDECALAVSHVMHSIIKEAKQFNIKTELLEAVPGSKNDTHTSALISLQGENLTHFISLWQGSICWICESPYRPNYKRKNWFVGVDIFSPFEDRITLNEKDLKFETMRASGPGGQHVNTTESAVRITHIPTGITSIARGERSQHMNKKLALFRLQSLLEKEHQKKMADTTTEKWEKHSQLERGNQIRVFVGKEFKERRQS